jgi:hypothetical protein
MSEEIQGQGRPTKYKPEYDNMAYLHCRKAGAKDSDLAELFNVAESTLNDWKLAHSSFRESLKKGKDEFDTDSVESALLNRALGCKVRETRISGGGDDDQAPAAVETVKELPPDPTACIFWLKNRNPERWRDKVEHEQSTDKPLSIEIVRATKPDENTTD